MEVVSQHNENDVSMIKVTEENIDEDGPCTKDTHAKKPRIPPVIAENVTDWKLLCQELKDLCTDKFQCTISGNKHIIKAKNISDFKKIREYVQKNNGGYSYRLQEEKPLKVVLKGVTTAYKTEDIAIELATMGFTETSVKRLHRQSTKRPMNLVLVELPKNEQNKKIYGITELLYQKIAVESFRTTNRVNQCFNCQGFGHGQLNCFLKPKCVKCAEEHHSKDCPRKSRQLPPKLPLKTEVDIDSAVGILNEKINNSYSKNTIVSSSKLIKNPKTKALIREKNKARKRWQSTWDPAHRATYLNLQGKAEDEVPSYLTDNTCHHPQENILSMTTPNEVKEVIKNLGNHKAPGHDNITPQMTKNLPIKWIVFLTGIFNAALHLCYFPKTWKHAIIITIPKKSPVKSPEDLRPISLLSTIEHEETRSQATMIEQTHNQVPQEPTTDASVAAFLRKLTLCLDQLLNRESEETITYDGDEPAAHFFSQLESQPNFHNLEPARQARKALSSLRGEPRKVAQDLALLNKTYEEVKESLCAVYPRRPSFTLQEFYELKCTSMADIETYYKNKVRIGLAINLPKSAIVQALSNGVPRNYGNLLKMAQPSGPEEWLCLAQQLTYEGDNTSTKAAQQRSPRQSRTPSTAVDKTPPYPCRYCGGQHWHAQCQQRGPYQRTFRTFTPAVHSVEQPQRSTGPAGVYETAATTSSGETNRALRSYERNYTISELECLAIVECVDKFRVYLLGTRFVIYSDHHALQWLKTIKDPTGRLFRWSLRLSAYDYEVKYLKGSRQYEADLLSRNPFCGFLSTGQIKEHQGELRRDTRYILNDKDLMTIIRRGVTKIIVPPSLRGTLLQRAHRDFNHPGISQMTRLIAAQYYWDGMTNDIRTHVRTCSVCQLVKPPKGPIYGELGQLPPAVLPYELVSLDTISGFAKYGNSQTCLHVVVDHATRYAWAFPSRSTSILTYTQVIKKVMQFGSPKRLLTDRAPAFTSPKFRRFLIRHNIGQLLTTSNNPQANGLSERLNATITGKLKLLRLQQPKTAWTKLLPQVLQAYNHTPHSVTGFPPSYLLLGSFPLQLSEHVQNYPKIDDARELAYQRTHERHLRDKARFDQTHRASDFEVGDLVLAKTYHHPDTGKLAPFFSGPYEILEIISPQIVRINRSNRPLSRETDTIHVNKLKHYTENEQFISPPVNDRDQPKNTFNFPYKHFNHTLIHTTTAINSRKQHDYTYNQDDQRYLNHLSPEIFTNY
ncbi:hypothetical protein LAZ67_9001432 [Cordylochernes scorpioides]|uniref:RNA-directed DNA polymerase n=1 Tax=Cordylochernes scorpioides TaxID=51811 RepID=A0ABY6KT04_9ARAC|nr:hypothetical protein LAZ67_9001432 [Cordylochernes scorpioides]